MYASTKYIPVKTMFVQLDMSEIQCVTYRRDFIGQKKS